MDSISASIAGPSKKATALTNREPTEICCHKMLHQFLLIYLLFLVIEHSTTPALSNSDFQEQESIEFKCIVNSNNYNESITINYNQSISSSHCGKCAKCSTKKDLETYQNYSQSLTTLVTNCALLNIFLGRIASKYCLKRIGFTRDCLDCWQTNIQCDKLKCLVTCSLYKLFGIGSARNGLDSCLSCDELECGPAFKRCAGANRRRAGIITDITRDSLEMCKL